MRKSIILLSILSATLLTACGDQQVPSSRSSAVPAATKTRGGMNHPIPKITEPPKRDYSFADVNEGGKLFHENCTTCHGQHGEGQPAYAGKPEAPPLNGTGHAWHHPKIGLMQTIMHGTISRGGNMPAWMGKLNEKQIEKIIAWMQSRWPDEIYAAWLETDMKARKSVPAR